MASKKTETKKKEVKKAAVKKAPVKAVKTAAKSGSAGSAAKKQAAKPQAKAAAKKTAEKASAKTTAASRKTTDKKAAVKAVKPAAKKTQKAVAPAKTTKAAVKSTGKSAVKTGAKQTAASMKKTAAKPAAATKASAKAAEKKTVKPAGKTAAAKNVKAPAKAAAKTSAKPAKAAEKKNVKNVPAAGKSGKNTASAKTAVKAPAKPVAKSAAKPAKEVAKKASVAAAEKANTEKAAAKTAEKKTAPGKKNEPKKKAKTKAEPWEQDPEDDDLFEEDPGEEYDFLDEDFPEPAEEVDPEREAIQAGFEEKLKSVIDSAKKYGYIDYHEVINAFAVYNLDEEQFDKVWEALDKNRIVLRIEPAEDDIPEEELALEEADEIELDLETLEKDVPEDTGVNDPVKMYLKEIGRVQLLSADEEVELAKQMEDGLAVEAKYEELRAKLDIQQKAYDIARKKKKATKEYAVNIDQLTKKISQYEGKVEAGRAAGKKLVSANLRLVVNIAKRYVGRGMHFLDLIQEGNLGLMKAVEKFDYRKGYKFSTYATWWIRQAITRAIADQARTIRIPVHMVETINKIIRINRQLLQELGREPSPMEIAERMDMPEERVREILKISQEPVSLETPIGEEEDSHLGDFIQDDNVPIPADAAAQTLLHEQLNEILRTLTERERRVLKLRFGLEDGKQRTLEEVGREFNVTRERIRQIEAKALRKLRHPSRSKRIKDFLE